MPGKIFFNKPFKWISLKEDRQDIRNFKISRDFLLRRRIENRISSTSTLLFKPRVNRFEDGYLQRPSKFLFIFIVPLFLLLILLLGGFFIEIKRSINGIGNLNMDYKVFLLILIFNILFILLIAYFNVAYFENKSFARIKVKSDPQTIHFDQIKEVVIKAKKIEFYSGLNEIGSDYTLYTRFIKPDLLVDYLAENFEVVDSDYKSLILVRSE